MTDETAKATVYLQIEPEYKRWVSQANQDTAAAIEGAKVVGYTLNKPAKPRPGTVVVKLAIEIPKGAFLPLRPSAVVVIPETLTQPHPVVVEAEDANEES